MAVRAAHAGVGAERSGLTFASDMLESAAPIERHWPTAVHYGIVAGMPQIDVVVDEEAPSLSFLVELPVSAGAAWRLWSEPRILERWWGPPTYPATVDAYDFVPGGRVDYHMTGPDGDIHRGWWRVEEVEAPTRVQLVDGFADSDGSPDDSLPQSVTTVTFSDLPEGGCRMKIVGTYASAEALRTLLQMGMDQGMVSALGQIDSLLPELGDSP